MDVVLHNMSKRSSEFQETIENASTTMKRIGLSKETQKDVLEHLNKAHKTDDKRKDIDSLLAKLPTSLKTQVKKHLFLKAI